jgi:hypothetical protein
MAAQQAVPAPPEPRHGLRIFLIWLVLALAADLVIWFVWGPHLPPCPRTPSPITLTLIHDSQPTRPSRL